MRIFEDQDEALEAALERIESLPKEKLGVFFLNMFGSNGLIEMTQDFIEGRGYEFETDGDIDDFINHFTK